MRFLIALAFLAGTSLASEAGKQEEAPRTQRQAAWYYASPVSNNLPFFYDYADQVEAYQLRSLPKRPASSYGFNTINPDETAEGRLGFGVLNGNLFASTRPATILNSLPVIRNPNFPSLLASSFDSCKASTGEMGICTPGFACSAYGGRPSGSCNFGTVCCINVVSTCSSQMTLNNTYWETPSTTISRPSSCSLTVKLDQRLLEQKRPICQVRLDFSAFSIEQPADATVAAVASVCTKDVFRVDGATNTVPEICGDNPDQHMYITVPNSGTTPTNLQLIFSFGRDGTVTPSWKIKVSLLPCGADYLAPDNCLQYFTSASGSVKSFNWNDVAGAPRQLANQNYRACFRTELIDSKVAKTMCLSTCSDNGFSLSGDVGTVAAQTIAPKFCAADYLIFAGGYNQASTTDISDRFCNTAFSAANEDKASTTVCSDAKPFALSYVTDGNENNDVNNLGFCLKFQQSA